MEDLANYPGLNRRKNTWYVRKRVPVDVAEMYKSETVSRSLKTDTLVEAKNLYHIAMLEIQSNFEQKRKEKQHKKDTDQLSKFSEAALLGLAFEWFNEGSNKPSKENNKVYTDEDIKDAYFNLQLERQEYQDALKTNDYSVVYSKVHAWLKKKEITYNWQTPAFNKFCTYLIKAHLFIYDKKIKEEYEGKTIGHDIPPFLKSVAHKNFVTLTDDVEPILLTDLLEQFLKQPERAKITEKNNQDYRMIVRRLNEYAGRPLYIHEITRKYLEGYRNTLIAYPSRTHNIKIFTNKDFQEIVKITADKKIKTLSPSTLNKHIFCLHALFDHAELNDLITKNPVKKLSLEDDIDGKDKKDPWSDELLSKIFRTPLFDPNNPDQFAQSKYDHAMYWSCLISLWGGLRLSEICQLHVEDLKNHNNIFYLDIVARPEFNMRLKNPYSIRKVPLHKTLINCGVLALFSECKKQKQVWLFPELVKGNSKNGFGHYLSKHFKKLMTRHGIEEEKCSFHSFRHNFRDALRDAEISKEVSHSLGGWSTGEKKTVADNYGKGHYIEKLNENLQKIQYPELDLTHLYVERPKDGHESKDQEEADANAQAKYG